MGAYLHISIRGIMITVLRLFSSILFLTIAAFLNGEDSSIKLYLKFLEDYPSFKYVGDLSKNEIKIVLDEIEIKKIQENEYKRLIDKGIEKEIALEWSRPGLIASDSYLMWIRDPVIFPKGHTGLYKRVIWKCTLHGEHPVAVLPITEDGKIILVKTWRHATGSWELELPRGAPSLYEDPFATALRELKEETGFKAIDIQQIGFVNPDSGVLSTKIAVFVAKGKIEDLPETDEDEIITGSYIFDLPELEDYLIQGFIEIKENGTNFKLYLRDPFLTYALYQAKLRQIL